MDADYQLPCWQHAHGCRMRFDTWTEVAAHHYQQHRRPDPLPTDMAAVIGTTPTRPRQWGDVRLLAVARNGTGGPSKNPRTP